MSSFVMPVRQKLLLSLIYSICESGAGQAGLGSEDGTADQTRRRC